jgi:hypothetical protein
MIKTEYFALTNEIVETELTSEEISEREAIAAKAKATKLTEAAQAQAKAETKAALLDRLGITAEEAALLLG